MPLADLQLSWELLTAIVTILGLLGAGFGYVIYIAHKAFTKLITADNESKERKLQESHQLQTTLLEQYKGLYELEKERSERTIADLSSQINLLRQEVDHLRQRQQEISEENEKLRALNLRLQQKQ